MLTERLAEQKRSNSKVWQCSEQYKVKGVFGCGNHHVEESTLEKAFVMAWNVVLENKEYFWQKWEEQKKSENLLEAYRVVDFQNIVEDAKSLEKMETNFMLRVLDHIKVFEDGTLMVVFLDGTEIECKMMRSKEKMPMGVNLSIGIFWIERRYKIY